jgi:hypothetical protein
MFNKIQFYYVQENFFHRENKVITELIYLCKYD